ncbi:PIG-L family deacetylase [Arthrobacter sp. A5]|uniref:PIG-L family deacetylase n=1 Tax=Arthrobacter sp. A5 TaxID=576926 RepID=UPI003DA91626
MTQQQPAPDKSRGGLLPLTGATGFRLLFVHAHPDDETLVTGATMALYAAQGAEVALLTCTRGELGEVIPAELRHLEVAQPGNTDDGDGLAAVRTRELAAALRALGVQRNFWLGQGPANAGPGPDMVYRDSGMSWGSDGRARAAETVLPGSLSRAPLDEVAGHAAQLIRTLRPHAVITYAGDGGYGHPDHIRTHELTVRAVQLAAAEDGRGRLPGGSHAGYPRPDNDAAIVGPRDPTADPTAEPAGSPVEGPAGSPVEGRAWRVPAVYTILSDRPERPVEGNAALIEVHGDFMAKRAAMSAHRTQVTVDGSRYALSDGAWKDISGVETFQIFGVADGDRTLSGLAPDGAPPAVAPDGDPPAVGGTGGTDRTTPPLRTAPSLLRRSVAAVAAGIVGGLLGTALHGHVLLAGDLLLPWGAAAALLLVLSLSLFIGLWGRSGWLSAVSGFAAYLVAGLLAIPRGEYGLVIGDLQGTVWLYGIAVATLAAGLGCAYVLRHHRSRRQAPGLG